jgi:hypothetical protein
VQLFELLGKILSYWAFRGKIALDCKITGDLEHPTYSVPIIFHTPKNQLSSNYSHHAAQEESAASCCSA